MGLNSSNDGQNRAMRCVSRGSRLSDLHRGHASHGLFRSASDGCRDAMPRGLLCRYWMVGATSWSIPEALASCDPGFWKDPDTRRRSARSCLGTCVTPRSCPLRGARSALLGSLCLGGTRSGEAPLRATGLETWRCPSIGCGASWTCMAARGCAIGALRPPRLLGVSGQLGCARGAETWMKLDAAFVQLRGMVREWRPHFGRPAHFRPPLRPSPPEGCCAGRSGCHFFRFSDASGADCGCLSLLGISRHFGPGAQRIEKSVRPLCRGPPLELVPRSHAIVSTEDAVLISCFLGVTLRCSMHVPYRELCEFLECRPMLAQITAHAANNVKLWWNLGRARPTCDHTRWMSVEIKQMCPDSGQYRPNFDNFAKDRQNLRRFRQILARFRLRPPLAPHDQIWSDFGQIWPDKQTNRQTKQD